jgi:hypothetical protein
MGGKGSMHYIYIYTKLLTLETCFGVAWKIVSVPLCTIMNEMFQDHCVLMWCFMRDFYVDCRSTVCREELRHQTALQAI